MQHAAPVAGARQGPADVGTSESGDHLLLALYAPRGVSSKQEVEQTRAKLEDELDTAERNARSVSRSSPVPTNASQH